MQYLIVNFEKFKNNLNFIGTSILTFHVVRQSTHGITQKNNFWNIHDFSFTKDNVSKNKWKIMKNTMALSQDDTPKTNQTNIY